MVSLTAAVSFSIPDTVTASLSNGTDMLLPHIHCKRCWSQNRGQKKKEKQRSADSSLHNAKLHKIFGHVRRGPNKELYLTQDIFIHFSCTCSLPFFAHNFQSSEAWIWIETILMVDIKPNLLKAKVYEFHFCGCKEGSAKPKVLEHFGYDNYYK